MGLHLQTALHMFFQRDVGLTCLILHSGLTCQAPQRAWTTGTGC